MRGLTATIQIAVLLIRRDLRLGFRRLFARFDRAPAGVALAVAGGALLVFHLLAWPAVGRLAAMQATRGDKGVYPTLAAGTLLVMSWLVSQAINGASRALYDRADMELTLSAPIPSSAVFVARCLSIAVEAAVSVGVFLAPIADVAAIRAGWSWLALYPALAASSLFATAVGVAIAFALFRGLGPRRARFVAQFAAAVVGAGFILSLQAAAFLPSRLRLPLFSALHPAQAGSAYDGLLWLPVRAAAGESRALAVWCLVSLIAFMATAALSGPSFVAYAVRAAGSASETPAAATRPRPLAFAAGEGRALRKKEWRLLWRDPWLMSQIFLQVVYTLPIGVAIWRSPGLHGSIAFAAAPTIVVVACQTSASFAWLVVSSEEAPELLLASPVTRRAVEIRKFQAIAPPLACLLGPPLLALAWLRPGAAALTFCFALCAAGSSALLNFWHPLPGRRTQVLRRHAQSKLVGLMEHLLSLIWAVAVCLALMGSVALPAPVLMALLLLYLNRPRSPTRPVLAQI